MRSRWSDEDAAAFIDPEDTLHVEGSGSITIVDTASLGYTSMASIKPGAPVCVTEIRLHVLTAAATYNLHTRKPTPPPAGRDEE